MTPDLGIAQPLALHRTPHAAVLRWVRRHLGTVDHERRVARIALELFDLTRPLHQLNRAARDTLLLAALTHDVGRCIAAADHHRHGARMVRRADLDLAPTLRRRVSTLVRHHKGNLDRAARRLNRDEDPRQLRILLGLLRAADAFDSRHRGMPLLVMTLRGKRSPRLAITACTTLDPAAAARLYARPRKLALLQETLGLTINITWRRSETVRMVA